ARFGDPATLRIDASGLTIGGKQPAAAPAAATPPAPSAAAMAADVGQIAMVGGTMNLATYDVSFYLLLESGTSISGIGALGDPGGIAAWMKRNPWSVEKWRKVGNAYEVGKGSSWQRMRVVWTPEPAGRKIAGTYHTSSNPTMGAAYGAGGSNVSFSSWR